MKPYEGGSHLKENITLLQNAMPLLIDWYNENKRALPWRQDNNPYHVWLSEIMLQQTRIEAVIPYYQRFLNAFPTVEALASAEEDRLMKLWQGLGYYSRARNLKKAAEEITSVHHGRFPQSAEELRRLPGIGDYTAGAIASIAFGQPSPAVDGNVVRVLARLNAYSDTPQKAKPVFTRLLQGIYPTGENAAALTQGLMELGEILCLPNGMPKCGECPLKKLCLAYKSDTTALYPAKAEKKERKTEDRTILLLTCKDKYALRRRPEKGLLAGLWEFPNFPGDLTAEQLAARLRAEGITAVSCTPCGDARHIFTHVEWQMHGYAVCCQEEAEGFVWKSAEEIAKEYAVPSAFRFYLRLLPPANNAKKRKDL